MADQTILANAIAKDIVVQGYKDIVNNYSDLLVTNGADMLAGMFITREGETSPDIDKIASGEAVYGIVLDYANIRNYKSGYTLGQTFPDNTTVKVLRRAPGITVQCILYRGTSSSLAVALGDPAYVADGDTWLVASASGAASAIGKVTNSEPATSGQRRRLYVGRFAKAHAVDSTEDLVTLVTLGL